MDKQLFITVVTLGGGILLDTTTTIGIMHRPELSELNPIIVAIFDLFGGMGVFVYKVFLAIILFLLLGLIAEESAKRTWRVYGLSLMGVTWLLVGVVNLLALSN